MSSAFEGDLDGNILESTFEANFVLDGTVSSGSNTFTIPPLKNVSSIWLSAYDVFGTPVVAGRPVNPTVYLDVVGVPMMTRCMPRDWPTANAVPLQLTGIDTHHQYHYPIQISSQDMGTVASLTFKLLNENGSLATYDRCEIFLTINTKTQPTSMAKVISHRPRINDLLDFRARPNVR